MESVLKDKTLEIITKSVSISVVVNPSGGFDELASGISLFLSLNKLGKNVSLFAKEPTVDDANQLYGVDKIGKNQNNKNFVIVIDDAVKTVEKVTYFLEENKLKIVIHPLPSSQGISQDQLSLEQSASKPNIIFTIGFKLADEMRNELTREHNIDSNTWTVNINREEMDQKFAQVNVNNPDAASQSEITCQLIQDLALPVDEDIAYNLYAGIASATQNFSPMYVRPTSFQAAQWLIKFGAAKASFVETKKNNTFPLSKNQDLQEKFETPKKIEPEKKVKEKWLKPPKIYKGSTSFDRES